MCAGDLETQEIQEGLNHLTLSLASRRMEIRAQPAGSTILGRQQYFYCLLWHCVLILYAREIGPSSLSSSQSCVESDKVA